MTDTVVPVSVPEATQPLPDPSDLGTWPARMAEMHRWMREDAAPGMSALGAASYANATAALEAANAALAAVNFRGAWSSLTGPATKGSSVSHSGSIWFLLVDLANITTSQPGVSADWLNIATASAIAFNPAGTGLTDTTVQAAVVSMSRALEQGNYLINGEMTSVTRGTSFAGVVDGQYTIDMWRVGKSNSAALTVSQVQSWDHPLGAIDSREFVDAMRLEVTTADTTIAAGDVQTIAQRIVGRRARSLVSNLAGFTLGFWMRSSKTGVHCVGFRNGGNNHSYVAEVNVTWAAGTWRFVTVYVPAPAPSGSSFPSGWDFSTGVGLEVSFVMACGSTRQTTAGTWQTGNFLATASQVNLLDTVGGYLEITGVRLYPGAVALRYAYEDPAITRTKVAARLRPVRLYLANITSSGAATGIGVTLDPPMAAPPSPSGSATDASTGAIGARSLTVDEKFVRVSATGNASGGYIIDYTVLLSCEL